MSRLDEELKIAIRRHEPSEGFADRVAARIVIGQATSKEKADSWWRLVLRFFEAPRARWAIAGAMACLLIALTGAYRYREYQREKAQAELAKAQVIYALQIASTKLNVAQRKMFNREDRNERRAN
jgi:hypothetical protein